MQGLAPIDAWAIIAIVAKATGYATSLLAIGGPLFLVAFRRHTPAVLVIARRVTIAACLIGLVILALRIGIRAGRIAGAGPAGMLDRIMLGIVWDSALGTAAVWRAAGYGLVLGVLLPGLVCRVLAVFGAGLLAWSFAQIGHVSSKPPALSVILVVHILMAGFWAAALLPLTESARSADGGALLRAFGHVATLSVPILLVAGIALAWQLSGSVFALVGTAYGATLLSKVVAVSGLLWLAAQNKLRLVPDLEGKAPRASDRLRRSIKLEMGAMMAILLTTATLTTVTTPPINM